MSVWGQLFDAGAPETRGERAQSRLVEGIALVYMVKAMWGWAFVIRGFERVVKPLALARYIDVSFLFDLRFSLANTALAGALGLVAFVTKRKSLYLPAVLAFHLQWVARHSLGKASHGVHFAGLALLALGLAGALFEGKHVRRAATGLTVFIYGVSYTSAAVCKLVATGPRWVDGRHLWMWMGERQIDLTSRLGSWEPNVVQRVLLDSRLLATCTLLAGLLTEAFAWLMWWRRPRPFVLLALVGMHLGIHVAMDVQMLANVLLLLALALPIARWVDRWAGEPDVRPLAPEAAP